MFEFLKNLRFRLFEEPAVLNERTGQKPTGFTAGSVSFFKQVEEPWLCSGMGHSIFLEPWLPNPKNRPDNRQKCFFSSDCPRVEKTLKYLPFFSSYARHNVFV
jgi:hypothetical protein